jgi:hypothetical protein
MGLGRHGSRLASISEAPATAKASDADVSNRILIDYSTQRLCKFICGWNDTTSCDGKGGTWCVV